MNYFTHFKQILNQESNTGRNRFIFANLFDFPENFAEKITFPVRLFRIHRHFLFVRFEFFTGRLQKSHQTFKTFFVLFAQQLNKTGADDFRNQHFFQIQLANETIKNEKVFNKIFKLFGISISFRYNYHAIGE